MATGKTTPNTDFFAGMAAPGMEWFQNMSQQTLGSLQAMATPKSSPIPDLAGWVAPSLDADELDKRIREMKAVHFWLEQNASMLASTIQALEVQKMTLSALKGMNVRMDDLAESLKLKPEQLMVKLKPAGETKATSVQQATPKSAPAKPRKPKADSKSASNQQVNPASWWNAMAEQFQSISKGLAEGAKPVKVAKQTATQSSSKAATVKPKRRASGPKQTD
ncbi:MAG: hypothetical protein RLZZ397_536 [Pseudomonadota bacterium]|jgi:predicted XRE-type DNA-binding protein